MTSKKKLQFIRDTYEFYFNRSKPFRDTELTEQEKEAFDSIEKDLEILEILKKRLNIKIPYGSVNVISCNNDYDYLLFEVELKEHTKIEEWLDNDK